MPLLLPPPSSGERSPARFYPMDYLHPFQWQDVFGRAGPVEVDLGCGDGGFLAAAASAFPDRFFLGVERLLGRVRKSCRRVVRGGLDNARLLRMESAYALRYLVPSGTVAVLHIAFPDPWPKRRHHFHRILRPDVLVDAHRVLIPGGEIRFTTDHRKYFGDVRDRVAPVTPFQVRGWEPGPEYPQTDFERRFRERSLAVHRLILKKCAGNGVPPGN